MGQIAIRHAGDRWSLDVAKPVSRTQRALRVVVWTLAWTAYQWWAVIGWPETAESTRATLIVTSFGSSLALTGWYCLQRFGPAWCRWHSPLEAGPAETPDRSPASPLPRPVTRVAP